MMNGKGKLIAWLAGGPIPPPTLSEAREIFNWLDGDPDAVHTLTETIGESLHGTTYDVATT